MFWRVLWGKLGRRGKSPGPSRNPRATILVHCVQQPSAGAGPARCLLCPCKHRALARCQTWKLLFASWCLTCPKQQRLQIARLAGRLALMFTTCTWRAVQAARGWRRDRLVGARNLKLVESLPTGCLEAREGAWPGWEWLAATKLTNFRVWNRSGPTLPWGDVCLHGMLCGATTIRNLTWAWVGVTSRSCARN